MKQLACTSCGATLEWDGRANVVECRFCGARFAMRGAEAGEAADDWRAQALRGGCVADRPCLGPCLGDPQDTGAVYYRSWLPQGWSYQVFLPSHLYFGASAGSPFVPGIHFESPDGRSSIEHITTNAYRDPTGMAVGPFAQAGLAGGIMGGMGGLTPGNGEMGLDGLVHYPCSVMDPRDFVRLRPFVDAPDYCDEMVLRLQLENLQVIGQTDQDDFARQRMEKLLADAPAQVRANHWYHWFRRTYRGLRKGEPVIIVAETQVSTNGWNVPQQAPQQPAQQPPSGFFGRMAAAMGGAAQQAMASMAQANVPRMWNTDYELVMIAPEAQVQAVFEEFDRIRRSIELGRDFAQGQAAIERIIMQGMQHANGVYANAQAQMAADRAASWDRRAAIIADTNAYTTNVMRDMQASNAASHERVAQGWSEAIRGVNSYVGSDGRVVEADIRYDHVYQGTPGSRWGSDSYVAAEGDWLEPGVDFVELPKRKL